MSFGATITLTVNSIAKVLNRINQDNYGSEYSLLSDTDSWNLKIRHSTDNVDSDGMTMLRHNVYLEHVTYATSTTPMYKESVTATFRAGKFDGVTQAGYDVDAMLTWLASGTVYADMLVGIN